MIDDDDENIFYASLILITPLLWTGIVITIYFEL